MSAPPGSIEDRLLKLSDPERRPELRKVEQTGLITNKIDEIIVLECKRDPTSRSTRT